jgi:hypothetical protein
MNLNTTKFFNSTDVYVSSRMNEYLKKNFGYEVEGDLDTLQEAKKSLEAEQIELKKESYMSQKYMENMLMIETIGSLLKAHGKVERTDEIIPIVGMALGAVGRAVAGGVAKMAGGAVTGAVSNATSNSVNASKKPKGKKKLNAVKEDEEEIMTKGGIKVKFNVAIRKIVHLFGSNYLTLAMKKFGINSLDDLKTDADKQKFFNYVYSINPKEWGQYKESIKEDDEEKGPEHYRYVNDSQLSRVQDRLRLTISDLDHAIQYRAKNSHLFFNTGDKAGTGDLYGIKEKLEKIDDEWDDQTELYGM